jgi:hypothetical protein
MKGLGQYDPSGMVMMVELMPQAAVRSVLLLYLSIFVAWGLGGMGLAAFSRQPDRHRFPFRNPMLPIRFCYVSLGLAPLSIVGKQLQPRFYHHRFESSPKPWRPSSFTDIIAKHER